MCRFTGCRNCTTARAAEKENLPARSPKFLRPYIPRFLHSCRKLLGFLAAILHRELTGMTLHSSVFRFVVAYLHSTYCKWIIFEPCWHSFTLLDYYFGAVEEVLSVEVIVLLCPSSLAHWLVGFRSGDSHCFIFVHFCFCFWFFGLFIFLLFFCFYFVSVFSSCFFCFISVFFFSFFWFPVIACFCLS